MAKKINDLHEFAKHIESLHGDILFDCEVVLPPEVEQHFSIALASLQIAQRHMKLAALKED